MARAKAEPTRERKLKFNAVAGEPLRRVPTIGEIRAMYAPPLTNGRPSAEAKAAQDSALEQNVFPMIQNAFACELGMSHFLGYPALAGLTQNGLIRAGVEMIADEMTRKWIDLGTTGEGIETTDDTIVALQKDMSTYHVRELFHDAAQMVHYYGGCLAYIDMGVEDPVSLMTPLYLDAGSVRPGTLRGFRLIEPYNVSPGMYNSSNPLSDDYFCPLSWYVLGREVHASRFLYFASTLPPTMLLPAYNFFGIPLAQTVLDVVNHFLQCREAEARLLKKFSLTVFQTDMGDVLNGFSDNELKKRLAYFVQKCDNDGVMMIDKEENIMKIETPLSGVTDIVRQSMEMVAAYFGEPVVKLWGISPGGFNSTGESDMRNHYDRVASRQEQMFREPLTRVLKILQFNRSGTFNENITATFVPIGDEDENALATVNKTKADTDSVLLQNGVISPEEVRQRLADDAQSGYSNIDVDAVPEDEGEGDDMGGMMMGEPEGGGQPAPDAVA